MFDMKVQIKNPSSNLNKIKPLYDYFETKNNNSCWEFMGLKVELVPTIDFKNNDALIRWFNVEEEFNDKLIVNSLEEFNLYFKLIHA